MLLALRINVLAKGYSGISIDTLKKYIDAFNGNSWPVIDYIIYSFIAIHNLHYKMYQQIVSTMFR